MNNHSAHSDGAFASSECVGIQELRARAALRLAESGSPDPEPDADWLLCVALNCGRGELRHMSRSASPVELDAFEQMLARRESGEPLQYVLGTQPFLQYELRTDPRALIPRGETEELCLLAMERLRGMTRLGQNDALARVHDAHAALDSAVRQSQNGTPARVHDAYTALGSPVRQSGTDAPARVSETHTALDRSVSQSGTDESTCAHDANITLDSPVRQSGTDESICAHDANVTLDSPVSQSGTDESTCAHDANITLDSPVSQSGTDESTCAHDANVTLDSTVRQPQTDESTCAHDANVTLDSTVRQPQNDEFIHVLDIGTGTGALAIAIALGCPRSRVTAVDISSEAASLARENAAALNADVEVLVGDLFAPVMNRRFDMIVSNPPYIPHGELNALQREVRREPMLALDGGADGLDFYRRIADGAREHLNPGGLVLVECGAGQAREVERLFAAKIGETFIQRDMQGIERMVGAELKAPK